MAANGTGAKRTSSAPPSRPGPSLTSAAAPAARKREFQSGFRSKLCRLDLSLPATDPDE
ncbi:unnamed protein product [Prunus armeniaca]